MFYLQTVLRRIICIWFVFLILKTCNGKPVSTSFSGFNGHIPLLPLFPYLIIPVLCENPVTNVTLNIAKSKKYISNESDLLDEEDEYDKMMALALAYTSVQRFKNDERFMVNDNNWLVNQRTPFSLDPNPMLQGAPPYFVSGVPFNFHDMFTERKKRHDQNSPVDILIENIMETAATAIRQCQIRSYAQFMKKCCRQHKITTTTPFTTKQPSTTEVQTTASTTEETTESTTAKATTESTTTEGTTETTTTEGTTESNSNTEGTTETTTTAKATTESTTTEATTETTTTEGTTETTTTEGTTGTTTTHKETTDSTTTEGTTETPTTAKATTESTTTEGTTESTTTRTIKTTFEATPESTTVSTDRTTETTISELTSESTTTTEATSTLTSMTTNLATETIITPTTTTTTVIPITTSDVEYVSCTIGGGCGVCAIVTILGGTISSPNFPDDYGGPHNCTYVLEVLPTNKKIQLTFIDFYIEMNKDWIDVYSRDIAEVSTVFNSSSSLTGYNTPPSKTSNSNIMTFHFVADDNNSLLGSNVGMWKAIFRVV